MNAKELERLEDALHKAARYLRDPRNVAGRFEHGPPNPHYPPNGSQWVPAYPDSYRDPVLGAAQPPEGCTHRLTIFPADAIGSPLQYVFRSLEIVTGTYSGPVIQA